MWTWMRQVSLLFCVFVSLVQSQESTLVTGLRDTRADTKTVGDCHSFYIYDWPNEQMSSWPDPSTVLRKKSKRRPLDYEHIDGENFGAGNISNPSRGIFVTKNSDQMYHTIMSRLRVHPQRTLDRSKACLRVIPMDLGISSYYDKKTGRFVMHKGCHDTVVEGNKLMAEAVKEAPLWGHEMMFISSMGAMLTLNCSTILYPCANCTRLQFETPDRFDDPYIKYALLNGYNVTYRWFGIPHVSNIHITDDMIDPPWLRNRMIMGTDATNGQVRKNSTYLVALWASPAVQRKKASRIRVKLIKECAVYPELCHLFQIKNRQEQKNSDTTVETFYGDAVFCLMPPGDGPTRKGIFDSMLMGCIPVMFDWHLLSRTYEWYFTKKIDTQCAVYVQGENYLRNKQFNIVQYLANISISTIQEKQQCVANIAHNISYAIPPPKLKPYIGFGGGKTSLDDAKVTWQPPMTDAVDVMLEAMYARISRFRETLTVPSNERHFVKKPRPQPKKIT